MKKIKNNQTVIPLLPLRDIVVFPGMITPLFVGRSKSISALEEVMSKDKKIDGCIYHPPSKDLVGLIWPYIEDINVICTKHMEDMNKNMKNSTTEHIFVQKISDRRLEFIIESNENLSEDEKKSMLAKVGVEERNRLFRIRSSF